MTITASALTGNGAGGAGSLTFQTATITPHADRLVLAYIEVGTKTGGDPGEPTLTGCGLTWVSVASVQNPGFTPRDRATLFRAMGTPSTGKVTITCGVSCKGAIWSIIEFAGVSTSGTNGSGAVLQPTTGTQTVAPGGSVVPVTLGAFSSALNGVYAGWDHDNYINPTTAGSGFTKVHSPASGNIGLGITTEWRPDNDTSVDITLVVGQITNYSTIAVELAAESTISTVVPTGIASTEAFGTLTTATVVYPDGIATAEDVSSGILVDPITLFPDGIFSEEEFGVVALSGGGVTISPTSIATAEAFGTLKTTTKMRPTGIASLAAVGTPSVRLVLIGAFLEVTEEETARVVGSDMRVA